MRRIQMLVLFVLCSIASRLAHADVIASIPVGNPTGIAFSPAGDFYWATSFSGNYVVKIRASDNVKVGTYSVGLNPTALTVTASFLGPSGDTVWVTNYGSNNVTQLDANTGALLGTFPVGSGPRGIVWDGISMWIANSVSNTVTRLDSTTVGSGRLMGTFPVGVAPYGLTFNNNDKSIWVANRNSNTVMKLSSALDSQGTILGVYPVASQPQVLLWDGTNIWVSSYNSRALTKLDGTTGATLSVTTNLPAGPGAMVLGSTVSGRVIWVACYASSTLAEVSVDSGVFLAAFLAPSNPYGLVQTPGGFAATSYTGNAVVDFFLR